MFPMKNFLERVSRTLKIFHFLEGACRQGFPLSYLTRLWRLENEQMFVLTNLTKFEHKELSILEVLYKSRERALSSGAVDKATNIRDGETLYSICVLKGYMENDDPLESDFKSDELEESKAEESKTEAVEKSKVEEPKVEEPKVEEPKVEELKLEPMV
jgi:hypothetical protein